MAQRTGTMLLILSLVLAACVGGREAATSTTTKAVTIPTVPGVATTLPESSTSIPGVITTLPESSTSVPDTTTATTGTTIPDTRQSEDVLVATESGFVTIQGGVISRYLQDCAIGQAEGDRDGGFVVAVSNECAQVGGAGLYSVEIGGGVNQLLLQGEVTLYDVAILDGSRVALVGIPDLDEMVVKYVDLQTQTVIEIARIIRVENTILSASLYDDLILLSTSFEFGGCLSVYTLQGEQRPAESVGLPACEFGFDAPITERTHLTLSPDSTQVAFVESKIRWLLSDGTQTLERESTNIVIFDLASGATISRLEYALGPDAWITHLDLGPDSLVLSSEVWNGQAFEDLEPQLIDLDTHQVSSFPVPGRASFLLP